MRRLTELGLHHHLVERCRPRRVEWLNLVKRRVRDGYYKKLNDN